MKGKRIISIVWGITGLLLTISLAVFLPQAVFMIQDYRQTSLVDVTTRETYEVLTTDAAYMQDVNARMGRMASIGYGDMEISKVERSMDIEECMNLISGVKAQSYMVYLSDMLPSTFGEMLPYLSVTQMETCDCYIVYSDDYVDGVILMFWYMVFDMPELGYAMELIVDSETETIYYVRLMGTVDNYNAESQDNTAMIMDGKDYYEQINMSGLGYEELLLSMDEEVESVAEKFPEYFDNYYARYYGIYSIHSPEESSDVHFPYSGSYVWENCVVGEKAYTMAYALPYSTNIDGSLFFRFYVEKSGESGPDISIGIPIIRRFVQS